MIFIVLSSTAPSKHDGVISASEMTYIVLSGALNSTHSLFRWCHSNLSKYNNNYDYDISLRLKATRK